jgi:NADPH:quinone reductase-like Zn-dependent oxidoreductase
MRGITLESGRKISLSKIKKPKIDSKSEMLVKVFYSPINPSDLGFSQNVYGRTRHEKYPLGLGFEGSGVIVESEDTSLLGRKICFVTNYENKK